MAAAKTEMLLSALQTSDPLGFPYSPMDSYPKLEELMLLHSAGTTFLAASTPEGVGFGTGETGDSYEHLYGGKGCSTCELLWFHSEICLKMCIIYVRSDIVYAKNININSFKKCYYYCA